MEKAHPVNTHEGCLVVFCAICNSAAYSHAPRPSCLIMVTLHGVGSGHLVLFTHLKICCVGPTKTCGGLILFVEKKRKQRIEARREERRSNTGKGNGNGSPKCSRKRDRFRDCAIL